MKAFPIPVVALGPGTQTEDESLDYLPMPKDMDTYRAPQLPEPEEIAGRAKTRAVLACVLGCWTAGRVGPGWQPADRRPRPPAGQPGDGRGKPATS
jgi:hydrogenase-1 operon protein HyaF